LALWRMITVAASQAALTGATTLLAWSLADGAAAQAAALGGGIAVTNGLLLAWRLRPSRPVPLPLPLAVERLILTVAAFAVSLGPLHVSPPPLLAGFAIAQLGHVAGCRACLADTDEPEGSSMPSPGALRAWPRPQWPLTGATVRACVKYFARRYNS